MCYQCRPAFINCNVQMVKCLNQITSKCILAKNYYMSTSVQLLFITTCLNIVFKFVFKFVFN